MWKGGTVPELVAAGAHILIQQAGELLGLGGAEASFAAQLCNVGRRVAPGRSAQSLFLQPV